MADEAAAKKLKSKIKGHLGHLKKQLDRWQGQIELAQSTKLDRCVEDMHKSKAKCEEILETCTAYTLEVNELEPDSVRNDQILDEWQKQYDEMFKKYSDAEKAMAPGTPARPPTENNTNGRSRAIRPKPNDPSKPEKLDPEAKPAVLRVWKKTLYRVLQ